MIRHFTLILFFCIGFSLSAQDVIKGQGTVHFISEAPLEIIEANSNELIGALDLNANTFAFRIAVTSFLGFNSPLQQEHFNEHYLETAKYPNSTFKGKIIEKIDWESIQTQTIRAKGELLIHGITMEKIIPVNLVKDGDKITAKATFIVPLEEFNIKLPKVVFNKIAENITVDVIIEFNTEP